MNTVQQGIVLMLKSAITGERLELPEDFELEAAAEKIRAHHIASLAYAGAVNCGVDPAGPTMQQLFRSYCRSMQVSERQMRALDRVFAAFEENGIDYLPLKGCIMKAKYPSPELRMMGDADVLIRMEQYERIEPVMRALGFDKGEESEQDYIWKTDALYLELHKCLVAPKYAAYHAYFGSGWARARIQSGSRYAMSVEDTFVFLFAHFAKHYSAAGVGCRHVADLWVYLRSHPAMDEAYLCAELGKLNLWKFYLNTRRLIAVWFEGEAPDARTDFMSEVIFANGSWGHAENRMLTRGVQDMGKSGSAAASRLKYLWRCAFPQRRDMLRQYPILTKRPNLLPLMWAVRLPGKLLRLPSLWRKHRKKLGKLNRDALDTRKRDLEYVGLMDEE